MLTNFFSLLIVEQHQQQSIWGNRKWSWVSNFLQEFDISTVCVNVVGDDDETSEGAKRQLVDNFWNHKNACCKKMVSCRSCHCYFTLPITHQSIHFRHSRVHTYTVNNRWTEPFVVFRNGINDSFFFLLLPAWECGTHKLLLKEKLRAMNKFCSSLSSDILFCSDAIVNVASFSIFSHFASWD